MNYLTNYYKTLSEELQYKLNILESYAKNLSEDLTAGGGVMQGSGSSSVSSTNTNQNSGGDESELQALLNAWGTNDPRFDYNQDGVVDGDDLGVALARMLPAGNSPQLAEPTFAGTNSNRPGSFSGTKVSALDQAGVENMSGAGADFGNGGVNPPRRPKPPAPGPNVGFQDVSGRINSPGYNTGSGMPPRAPKPPFQGPGVSVQDVSGKINSPGFNTGSGMPPRGPKPPVSGPGVSVQDVSGRISPGFDISSGDNFGQGGNPRKPNPPIRPTKLNYGSFDTSGDLSSYNANSGYNPQSPEVQDEEMGGIPYWMSQRTTQTDASFRGMQRRKRN